MPGRPPNLLFILTDEQRYDTLACYGNRQIEMPNLNRLADQSVVFDQAYVTQPLCTPARSSLLTGTWPHANGCTELNVPLSAEVPCLPERVPPGRYVACYCGKWHLGDEIFAQRGFTHWAGTEDGYAPYFHPGRDPEARSAYHHWLRAKGLEPANGRYFGRGEAARLPEPCGKPAFLGESASRFIRENAGRPWMLYVSFLEPHMPYFGPRDDQYDPREIPLPPNFDHPPTEDHPLKLRMLREHYRELGHSGLPLQTPAQWRRMIANYWGLCSLVDTHVGHILDALQASGQWDNTIIVFTSDHGDMMGSHQLLAKTVMYEESVRVPMLVKMPRQRRPRRVRGPVSQIDLVPTLLELMDQEPGTPLPGKSLLPWMNQDECRHDQDVFIEQQGPDWGISNAADGRVRVPQSMAAAVSAEAAEAAVGALVRTVVTGDGWKFNHSALGEHELYHLATDPLERRNLAADPDQRSRIESLLGRLDAWWDGENP